MAGSAASTIQSLCELGQSALLATDYHAAEQLLAATESLAWDAHDYDALARLYMPLQEARRQRRQLSGDGAFVVRLSRHASDVISAVEFAGRVPRGQVLVAGHGNIRAAMRLRTIAAQRRLSLDVLLAATYVLEESTVLLIVPTPDIALPSPPKAETIDDLLRLAPPHSLIVPADALPPATHRGDAGTFGYVMGLWEALHAPFLAAADAETDPKQKLALYRHTIRVDYACEFAHQRFSDTARLLSRKH